MRTFNRRHAFQVIAQLSLYGSIVSCHRGGGAQQEDDLLLLSGVAYELMPYSDLPSQLYLNAAENILLRDPEQASEGISALRELTGTSYWSDLNDQEREQIIHKLQGLPFFVLVRTVTIETLYREQPMFDLLGYGGSAIEQGGYINRGFDDIDWLPGGIN